MLAATSRSFARVALTRATLRPTAAIGVRFSSAWANVPMGRSSSSSSLLPCRLERRSGVRERGRELQDSGHEDEAGSCSDMTHGLLGERVDSLFISVGLPLKDQHWETATPTKP
jgi:hypothetical protein